MIQKSEYQKSNDKFWLIRQIILALTSGFFIYFGIHLLMGAFTLNEPFSFILTFFASNFIILISVALLVGFFLKILAFFKEPQKVAKQNETEENE